MLEDILKYTNEKMEILEGEGCEKFTMQELRTFAELVYLRVLGSSRRSDQILHLLYAIPWQSRPGRKGETPLGMFVVKKLMESYLNAGYNVCTDNFFTSAPLADYLFQ